MSGEFKSLHRKKSLGKAWGVERALRILMRQLRFAKRSILTSTRISKELVNPSQIPCLAIATRYNALA